MTIYRLSETCAVASQIQPGDVAALAAERQLAALLVVELGAEVRHRGGAETEGGAAEELAALAPRLALGSLEAVRETADRHAGHGHENQQRPRRRQGRLQDRPGRPKHLVTVQPCRKPYRDG